MNRMPRCGIGNRGAIIVLLVMLCACHPGKRAGIRFETMNAAKTGLHFNNKLSPTIEFNVLQYMYFYNGGGVGAGDFNNDGKIDLFFAGNQVSSALFLNRGDLKFEDVTAKTGIVTDSGWSTGVSVVDINNDGLLDLYICRVGNHETLHSHNLLLVCTGIRSDGVPEYREESKKWGLDFSGFSSQAAFFDYDGDGDLDMFLLNHSIHQNGTFGKRSLKLQTSSPVSGDRMFRNNGNGTFTDVTGPSGIHSSVIGYGLGIGVADIDLDGYPDLYIGNDFHENDYLYLNRHDGTFSDELTNMTMHTSQYSMGVDIGDLNEDGYPEIVSMDMLPSDPVMLKQSLGEDDEDIFNMKISFGYNNQYTRNNLQYNRRNGHFSETGLYSGVAATDWSWSPLFIDFDNDGRRDLFISNGIPKRLNDRDYLNFISNQEIQDKLQDQNLDRSRLAELDKFPEIKLPNRFFHNAGSLAFSDEGENIQDAQPTFSNGAIVADLDGDGDQDIVVSNINDEALLYRNAGNDSTRTAAVDIHLNGSPQNRRAVGAKLVCFSGESVKVYEKFPVHGFLSSMETDIHIGLGKEKIDSAFLIWPDNRFQPVHPDTAHHRLSFDYSENLPRFDYSVITNFRPKKGPAVSDITAETGINFLHKENDFHEFDREPLLPHMLSTEGPALAVGDINGDGLDDAFIGGAKWQAGAVFLQQAGGKFVTLPEPALALDSVWEDVDAVWQDMNGDHFPDLVVASGGNEFYGKDQHLLPRLYLNDGRGHLTRMSNAFPEIYVNASCVAVSDVNGDGYPDVFVGGRSVPTEYGQIPPSYLMLNDGHGNFQDVTASLIPAVQKAGFVTSARWIDLDKDGNADLLLTFEWGGITAWLNKPGGFKKMDITDRKGWWNFVLPVDLDGDGDLDFIAGNLGLNSRLKASPDEPVRLYYTDFEGAGHKEKIVSYYVEGKEIPFANKDELQRQLPSQKKKFLYAADFAKASMASLFGAEKLKKADTLTADYFANAVIYNEGNGHFRMEALPWEAQLSSLRDAAEVPVNDSAPPDILTMGNYYGNNIQMGRYDADFGTMLLNKSGKLETSVLNGLAVTGQVRKIRVINIGGKKSLMLARNNDSVMLIRFQAPTVH